MSARKTPVWTWRDAVRQADVPPLTKLVCYSIANYLTDLGRGCFPGVETLIADTGLSNRSVATHVQHAVDAGLLVVERRRAGNGQVLLTHYLPRFPDNAELARDPAAMQQPHDEENDGERHVKDVHVAEPEPCEGGSRGPREPGAQPREPDDISHVNLVQSHIEEPSISELSTRNTPPQPPADRGGRRGRDRSSEIEQVLHSLRTERPQRGRVIDLLLAPVVTQRRLDAPSASGTLASLADWPKAADASDAVLRAAAAWLLETRKATVKPADFQDALRADHVRAADQVWLERGSPEWLAWVRWLEAQPGKRSLVPHIRECSRWAFPSAMPPAGEPRPSAGTEHEARP